MRKHWMTFLAVVIAVYLLIGRGWGIKHRISQELQLDLFWGNSTIYHDNHDHLLHNDGVTVMVMEFSQQSGQYMQKQLTASLVWDVYPLPPQLQSEIYEGGCYTWDTPSTFAEMAKLPQVENGYWFFIDQTAHRNGTPRYGRKALDGLEARKPELIQAGYPGWEMPGAYALALYDLDSDTLYYFQKNR